MIVCPTCGAQNPTSAAVCSTCGTPLRVASNATSPVNSVALPPDTPLRGGAYVVGPVLGQGGFGITYKARDLQLNRFVAIKEFFPFGALRSASTVQPTGGMTLQGFQETKRKFLEEAQTLARFSHPSIVRVYSVWEENNTAYLSMEFLEGKTLQKIIDEKGSIPEKVAVGHIKAVAQALEQVHAAGLIHRDLKPDNICVTNDGRTVLIDFGTARAFASNKTVRQTAMLTPGYAPLEQYGQQAKFGAYSDVYALGATLYHCLTGKMPAPATDRVSGVEVPAPDQINPAISPTASRAVMHALQIRAPDRPQTMGDFVKELERPLAPPVPRPAPPPVPNPVAAQAAPPTPASVPTATLGGGFSARRIGDGQIVTNAPPDVALSALWRGFSTFGVSNPRVDYPNQRVVGTTPLDLRSYGQNITGTVLASAHDTLLTITSQSGMPLNLTDMGRSRSEQRALTEHVEQALLQAPPNGYWPGGMSVGAVAGPNSAPPPAPISAPYGGGVPVVTHGWNDYQTLPTRRGGEVISYGLLALSSVLCGCTIVFAPIAWLRGNAALAEYGDRDPGDRSTVVAGRMMGIVMTVLAGVGLLFVLIGALSSNS